jgi:hypothetical protein
MLPFQLIAAAIAKAPGILVTLTNQNQTRVGTGAGSAKVGIRLNNTGDKFIVASDVPTWSQVDGPEEWLEPNKSASDTTYSVRATEVSADANWQWEGHAVDGTTWHVLDTSRNFYGSKNGPGSAGATLKLEISNDGGSTIIATAASNVLLSDVI